MVKGLDLFKQYFEPVVDHYVLIGGTACMLSMEHAGLPFRATKDLDIVLLCVDKLDMRFVEVLWKFIKAGGYQYQQKSTGEKIFYRFYSPKDLNFPEMLELFSKKPDAISIPISFHLTPIPVDEELSSLSAILLDKEYYSMIHEGKTEIKGLSILRPEYLIPLKVKAWLNLSALLDAGETIDNADIRKHKNDVMRLYQLLSVNTRIRLSKSIQEDMTIFLKDLNKNPPNFKMLDLKIKTPSEIVTVLTKIYGILANEI